MRTRLFALVSTTLLAGGIFVACSATDTTGESSQSDNGDSGENTTEDASTEGDSEAAEQDAGCTSDSGCAPSNQDCIGFGEGAPCLDTSNPYGYTCVGGPPMDECEIATESSLGTTYCCPELTCTHVASGDKMCPSSSAYFECPTADGGLLVSPAEGCTPSTGEGPYAYFCCPN